MTAQTGGRPGISMCAMQNPTLRDVAEKAGVHTATASRALNPETRGLVSAETAQRVLRIAKSIGYQPNPIARSLKTAKSRTIGVVIPDLTNPLFPPIVRGIDDVLRARGYTVLVVNTDNDPEREESLVRSLRSRHVEGLIVATARLEHPLLEQLQREGVQMVMVNRRPAGMEVATVSAADAEGMATAVRHLADLGHRRVGHLAGPQDTSTGVLRMESFRSAVREHDLDDDPTMIGVCDYWSETEGARSLRALLERGADPTAIVAGNDLIAIGCFDVFRELGINCPEQISVVGFNGMPFLENFRPPLTTVAVPHYEIGVESANMLLESIKEPSRLSRSVQLPVTLVSRESTGPPPRRSAPARRSRATASRTR